jgi:hypothetical protein
MTSQSQALLEKIEALPPEALTELETMVTQLQTRYGVIDDKDYWTEEDMRDFALASLRHAARSMGEDE